MKAERPPPSKPKPKPPPPPPPKPVTPVPSPPPRSPTPPPPPPTPLPDYIAQFIGQPWFESLYQNATSKVTCTCPMLLHSMTIFFSYRRFQSHGQ